MLKQPDSCETGPPVTLIDALLYLLTASAMTLISVSFLLWLRF